MFDGSKNRIGLHIIISNPDSAQIAQPLAAACTRTDLDFSVFVTGDGVAVLSNISLVETLNSARPAVVCRDSWVSQNGQATCPFQLGSQTNSSALIAQADRILGL